MIWLLSDYGIQWTVLGILRQFYTFRERTIISKIGAGSYAIDHVPVRWDRLIHEAVNIRYGRASSPYRFRVVRAWEAFAFMQLIITACDAA